ncbi:HEPN domain-containing protein [Methylobacterium hispanicum]|uniref:HEPN domain-containing protein n=1 Tax=Methylobacterium hispanicum TaxID=270350 RepID=UPI002F359956
MEFTPLRQIGRRFAYNRDRVSHLIEVHKAIGGSKKLKAAYRSDILRSAVVLLHAALEDLLREMIRSKAAEDPGALYKQLVFPGSLGDTKVYQKIEVADLERFRGITVEDLIQRCVDNYLARRSFNNKSELVSAITAAGLIPGNFSEYFDDVVEAISRRHKIVHEGDRTSLSSKTHGKRVKIDEADVTRWLNAVTGLGKQMLKEASPAAATDEESNV